MKNKLKNILIIFVFLITIFTVVGCGKQKDPIIGSWELDGFVYTFYEDNTGEYELFGETMKFTYEIDDKQVSLLFEGYNSPIVCDYRIEDDTLIIIDSFGSEVKYKKQ